MIDFRNVSFKYDKKSEWVLKGITFRIGEGELVALVGKNGAGKTTLLKHINGLLKPTEGEVWIDGKHIKKASVSSLAQKVGFAFQNPNHQLFAETVKKELAFGPKNLHIDTEEQEEKINEIAKLFNITHLLERNPLELSGGEKRLVSIASVLTMGQKILVLDEPTFGQDYRQKKRLGNYINTLSKVGVTVLIVSHDIDFILDYFSRVIVLVDGQIIADGSSVEILKDEELLQQADLEKPILLEMQEQLAAIIPRGEEVIFDEEAFLESLQNYFFKESFVEGKKK